MDTIAQMLTVIRNGSAAKLEKVDMPASKVRENVVKVYPRKIDLENVVKLADFEATQVVADIAALTHAIHVRLNEIRG